MTIEEVTLIPGNGTQYNFDIIPMGDGTLLVCYYESMTRNYGRVMRFNSAFEYEYEPYYVTEKLECSPADSGVILAYLHKHYKIHVFLDARYNPENGVWIGHVTQ